MTHTTILDRRRTGPVVPPADLRPDDRFLNPQDGRTYVLEYQRPGAGADDIAVSAFPVLPSGRVSVRRQYLYLDPSALVNLEAR